jgi:hypothetical protein
MVGVRRALLFAVPLLLAGAVAACGDAPERNDAPFCEQLQGLQTNNPLDPDASDAESIAAAKQVFDDLVQAAPFALKEDLRTLRRVVDEIGSLDPTDPDDAERAAGIIGDAKVLSALRDVRSYAVDQCGLPDLFGGEAPVDDSGG